MKIGKNHKIESDNLNVILYRKKKRVRKNGEVYVDWEVMGYFATVQNALKELVNRGVRDTELADLKTIVKKQDELYALIERLKMPSNRLQALTEASTASLSSK